MASLARTQPGCDRALQPCDRHAAEREIRRRLGPLPLQVGDMEEDLVRVLDPVPESLSSVYLLVHPDLRDVPRVRALFDFMVSEIDSFRPLLGHWR
jgi:DNA-binding transcriptional LysR family regulator